VTTESLALLLQMVPTVLPSGVKSMNTESQQFQPPSSRPLAVAAWHSLVSGRYRISRRYDSAGKRYLVATPNPNGPLTERQRDVLASRARGKALKVIAFDLGVSVGTVSQDLSFAMQHVGLCSSADLAAVFGHAAG
jgi:DNA-binding NarL/FixJ family response regulator